ncbi:MULTISPECIES: helix-turn-helix domain-containing protein [Streptomycetaceae]|uniref:Transcriptional regulator, XRE family n=1 Tax=Streptantibioticus cattleyicolor (strain ATCC 35852 / DSM 46488 / JCM 4925 / NBRC 14057 / NRRL 8057) TaxID=1003195 RepID=F8JV16_STREN|nr:MULTISPECIES: helix-turn-helix transcriptional regulator [Streptomycetaceae]AEW98184.1 transcriptional regulator, XRE family [Streptantibioticus cattleyicolor NRRL 8057 = DSM 46488]MYS62568.1 helix-turn-helix domain-containing protein [Streptomyces sp. SID5468]CCB78500.1 Transcriptional regulator, XRE family [Streptantibioticus cattleyicolor NRRL 8057 = DSM 46488]
MDTSAELGEFLRSRRARLRPADVGLPPHTARRKVTGLRREELAMLAGVSLAYYTRLEQGAAGAVSDQVLASLARALRLTEEEGTHLRALARAARRPPRTSRTPAAQECARPATRRLIGAMDTVPALAADRRGDVLAWNRLGHLLFAGHLAADSPDRPADRPNLARLLFLDPHTRELFTRWETEARDTVAALRRAAARHPEDRRLAALIGRLSLDSPQFAAWWSRHPVRPCAGPQVPLHHPVVGPLTLTRQTMRLTDDSGHRLMLFTAEPGSPSHAALCLLARCAAEPRAA